ncbi:class I SAM-dependent methyltransferase [Streptomyces sp. ME19-01-6]|uniref:O-methyltransferase n=1 Tax=Streptomyces sp. ME19-01-6 TaxID=3028686 RepID=UPI0029B96951|nr:class I SAM-dependent methyltransferase [Streptomyces sp. ME19-01-6]MDX3225232.1 class I SAM-dependent methyltransferase [Streptomyces sp. ME19-01-6]
MEEVHLVRWFDAIRDFTKELWDYVMDSGTSISELSASVPEMAHLMHLVETFDVRNVIEVGFNIGFSSHAFLSASDGVHVVSFDVPENRAALAGKEFIDQRFPGRHQLIMEDSRTALPKYIAEHGHSLFDFAFVDGGHDYDVAKSDIDHCGVLCRSGSLIVVDDLTPWVPWGVGPTRAWTEALEAGSIKQEEIYRDGFLAGRIEGPADRVWAQGRVK